MRQRNYLWVVIVAIASICCWQAAQSSPQRDEDAEMYRLFVDAVEHVDRSYVKPVKRRELIEAAIHGMLEHLDPSLVKMQFQVAAITAGYKAQDYFRKFPGRFISAHLQDYAPDDHKKEVVMGTGIVDWKDFFAAAKAGGLKYIFVEMESNPAIMEGCAKFLKNLV